MHRARRSRPRRRHPCGRSPHPGQARRRLHARHRGSLRRRRCAVPPRSPPGRALPAQPARRGDRRSGRDSHRRRRGLARSLPRRCRHRLARARQESYREPDPKSSHTTTAGPPTRRLREPAARVRSRFSSRPPVQPSANKRSVGWPSLAPAKDHPCGERAGSQGRLATDSLAWDAANGPSPLTFTTGGAGRDNAGCARRESPSTKPRSAGPLRDRCVCLRTRVWPSIKPPSDLRCAGDPVVHALRQAGQLVGITIDEWRLGRW